MSGSESRDDSNSGRSLRFCKLQIAQCQPCRECQHCRGALHAVVRTVEFAVAVSSSADDIISAHLRLRQDTSAACPSRVPRARGREVLLERRW